MQPPHLSHALIAAAMLASLAAIVPAVPQNVPAVHAKDEHPVRAKDAHAQGSSQDAAPPLLATGQAVDRQLAPGETHTYRLHLHRGDYYQVTVGQRGIDVAVSVMRDDRQTILSVDACDDDFRDETVVAIADAGGEYALVVRPASPTAPAGRYSIRLDAVRPAEPGDDDRVATERSFERGRLHEASRQPSEYPEALANFQQALDGFERADDRRGELKTLIGLSYMQFNLGQAGDALASAQRAEAIARELGDEAGHAAALHRIGLAQRRRGELAAALAAEEQSTAISRAIGNRKAEATSLNGEGVDYASTDDAERAVIRFEQALRATRASGDRVFEGGVLNNLSNAYRSLGDLDKSLEAIGQSLQRHRAEHNVNGQAIALNNMGQIWHQLHDERHALALYTQALAFARASGDKEAEARSLNTIGQCYYALGEFAKALAHHRESLAIRRDIGDRPGQAVALQGEGRALNRLGDSDAALRALNDALATRRSIHDQFGEGHTLHDLAAVERDRGDLDEALAHVKTAVDLEESLRARITSPQLRTTFVAAGEDNYALLIDLLQQQHQRDASAGHDADALAVSERARARVLLESLLDAHVDLRGGIDAALLDRERDLQKQLSDASAQLSRVLTSRSSVTRVQPPAGANSSSSQAEALPQAQPSQDPSLAQRQAAERRVDQLTRDYQQLEAEIRRESPHYASLTQPEPLDTRAIQQTVLDDDTVLLEVALGDDASWLWAVTPQAIVSVKLPPRRRIEAAARALYDRYTARQKHTGIYAQGYSGRVLAADTALETDAKAMSRMLFGGIAEPLAHEWRGKRLAIVASGSLEYLPFAALPEPAPEPMRAPEPVPTRGPHAHARRAAAVPLIAHHEIVMMPSASVVAGLRREAAAREPAPGTIAILADPVFAHTDPRARARAHAPTRRSAGASARDAGFNAPPGRLPFSREEADAIAALARPGDVLEATGFQANRSTVLEGTLARFRIVHFATHGLVDTQRPALTGLVLSLIDEHGTPRDGYLRLHDIYNVRLNADLVVLSACDTALGKSIRGEGLVGLVRAFMYAGAPRVVASLWEVNDGATAQLMKAFYRGLLRQQLSPAAALRAAQLEIAKNPRWAAPYYWAGFVLQGDWQGSPVRSTTSTAAE